MGELNQNNLSESDLIANSIRQGTKKLWLYNVTLLKLLKTNGDGRYSFPNAYCSAEEYPEMFRFCHLFQPGYLLLFNNFIDTTENYKQTEDETALLQKLKLIFKKSKDIANKLTSVRKIQKTEYSVQLAHHLLAPLSMDSNYKIDHHTKKRVKKCICCKEEINGEYDDTSMGDVKVWHGNVDILIGKSNKIPVLLTVGEDEKEEIKSDTETEQEELLSDSDHDIYESLNQLIAETVVFGFVQNALPRNMKNALVPVIGISKDQIIILFYDAVEDFLFQSTPMSIFTKNEDDLQPATLVALWLTINYPLTCSGMSESMIKTGFKSDFLKDFEEGIQNTYIHNLKFKNCGNTSKCKRYYDQYFLQSTLNCEISKPARGTYDYVFTDHIDRVLSKRQKTN